MTYKDRDIFKCGVGRSAVKYGNPMVEWFFAARFAGYTWEQFQALPGERQSFLVAAYRLHGQIEAVLAKNAK